MARPRIIWLTAYSLLLIALFASCTSTNTAYVEPPALAGTDRARLNLEIHDAVWGLVNKKYFDPKFRGVDWAALRTKYRDEAAAAKDDTELYRVLNRLCHELKESHLSALAP